MTLGGESLRSGERVAVVGRSGSGRSRLLATVPGERVVTPTSDAKRTLLDSASRGPGGPSRFTEVTSAAGLWERRGEPMSNLSPGQRAAAGVSIALLSGAPLLVADGQFDLMDPWTRAALFEICPPTTLVFATQDLDLAGRCERVAVVGRNGIAAFAAPEDLILAAGPVQFTIETGSPGATRELIAPLAVDVRETPSGLHFHARDGQALAARLLTAGYGTIESFVVRSPTLAEAIARLID